MFTNLLQLQRHFKNELVCIEFIEQQRWQGKPECPHCGSEHYYRTATRLKSAELKGYKDFWCKACNKKYTALTGSIYQSSKVSLQVWLCAVYVVTAHKKGISSVQLAKDLGVTQKTAWYLIHRIREMLKDKFPEALNNIVEVDETYIGGRIKNRHKKVRQEVKAKGKLSSHTYNKTGVMGLLERNSKLKVQVIDSNVQTLREMVKSHVSPDATIMTDSLNAYSLLKNDFKVHEVIKHDQDEYVRGYVHTNSIEGFFSQLKRSIYGIYHQVSPKHLQRYCDENAYRFNSRDLKDADRFTLAVARCGGSQISYKTLIGKL